MARGGGALGGRRMTRLTRRKRAVILVPLGEELVAYQSGGLLQFVNPDLSTRAGAQSAMDSAKFGFLIVTAFRVVIYALAAFAAGSSATGPIPAGIPLATVAVMVLLDIGLPAITAWRLHVYKGAFITPVTAIVYVLGIVLSLNIPGMVIGALFTAVFVGGIRGAWALRRDRGFSDDMYATFN